MNRCLFLHTMNVIHNILYQAQRTWFTRKSRLTTTYLQRPQFSGSIWIFYNIKRSLNNDHLSTTVTYLRPQGLTLDLFYSDFFFLFFFSFSFLFSNSQFKSVRLRGEKEDAERDENRLTGEVVKLPCVSEIVTFT